MVAFLNFIWSLPWGTILQGLSAIATIIMVVGIFLAIRQLRFEAWNRAQDLFVKKPFRDARGKVFGYLEPLSEKHDDGEDQEYFKYVCEAMDEFCHLSKHVGESKFLSTWYDPIGKAWYLTKDWVKVEQDKTGWKTKWDAFETVGKKALKMLKDKGREPIKDPDKMLPK